MKKGQDLFIIYIETHGVVLGLFCITFEVYL